MLRTNEWLDLQLQHIWQKHFSDIEQVTPIKIQFGRRAYRRLGSIILSPSRADRQKQHAHIVISGILADTQVPEFIIQQVIAHELVHYIHGFGSHLPRHLKHPHQGGVIVREFKRRGLWELFRAYQSWMKINWLPYLKQQGLH